MSANSFGFLAILFWGALALLSAGAGNIPPFELGAIGFGVGALVLTLFWRDFSWRQLRALPLRAWLLGVLGIWLYHAVYFYAVQNAPVIEASLLGYLWPLLIVLFARIGKIPRWQDVLGALLGLLGSAIVIGKGSFPSFDAITSGHIAALVSAFLWAGYSLLSSQLKQVPSQAIVVYLWIGAILFAAGHFAFEDTVIPQSLINWGSVILLGIFPLGLAFVFWDIGMKRGDVSWLGTLSYIAPLLSVLLLVTFGMASWNIGIPIGAVAIALGAFLASLGARK